MDEIVLDTGCKQTMVHQKLVAPDSLIEGDVATIRYAHGDMALYPLAKVQIVIPIEVEAAVSSTLPVSVLLGGHSSSNLLAVDGPNSFQVGSDNAIVVITRVHSRKQFEEKIVRTEQELLSRVEPKKVAGIAHAQAGTSNQDTQMVSKIVEYQLLSRKISNVHSGKR